MITSRNMILVLVLTLAVFGIVMIYSASFIAAENSSKFPDGYFFLRKQIVWLMVSLLGLFLASQIDFHLWRKMAIPFLAVCMVLLCAVLVPGLGTQVGGARRWLRFGALGFQPSELTKLAVVVFMGWFCSRDPKRVRRFFSGFVLAMVVLGLTCALVLLEPDIGTAFFIGLLGCSLFVIGGGRLAFILPSVALAVPCGYFALMTFFPHARDRITTFLNPDLDPLGKGHQIKQSLIALGSGGDFGVGLGMSRQKLLFLPEEHTDFIFSVIGEELGFAGAIAVILLFVLLFWYARKVALGTRDPFARIVAFGIGLWTVYQAAFNIAVASAAIPTKGISLPFISFGGSHLFCSFVAIGVLLNIAGHADDSRVVDSRGRDGRTPVPGDSRGAGDSPAVAGAGSTVCLYES